jgi:glycosyltransferase involved in cell wall biosynthesis
VADFRDPWTEIDYYHELRIGKTADRIQKKLEKAVLTEADLVISIGANCAEGLARIGNRPVEVFTNGFIFPSFDPKAVNLDEPFTIAHMGSMSFARNPEVMWQALAELITDKPEIADDLEVKLIGPVDYEVLERAKHYGLEKFIKHNPLVSHAESIALQRSAQLLLLVANRSGNVKGILTGKFFEYLGAKRPILAIGEHESDLETVMNDTHSGIFVGYDDVAETKAFLLESWEAYRHGNLYSQSVNTEQFDSAHITHKLIARLNSL